MAQSDRIMFEIYREAGYGRQYRVVYFTELDEHNKEQEISRAAGGDHLFDGFLEERHNREAKEVIAGILDSLNDGKEVDTGQVRALLTPYMVD